MTELTDEQALGQRIRKSRNDVGLRQADMAELLGLDPTAISRIESGERRVSTSELGRIAEALAVSPLALLDDESPLAEMAAAARTVVPIEDARTVPTYVRGQALMELYAVLSDQIGPALDLGHVPSINENDADESGEILAEWAYGLIGSPDPRRFNCLEPLAEAIEEYFGFDVLLEPDAAGIDGLTTVIPEATLIQVNTAKARRRCTFTLAHELGHGIKSRGTVSLSADPETDDCHLVQLKATTPTERWCNAFAAALLLPERWVQDQFDRREPLRSALELYVDTGASWSALVYRLKYLKALRRRDADRFETVSPLVLARDPQVPHDLYERVLGVDASASNTYRPPRRLTAAALRGAVEGVVSIRPYADLVNLPAEEALDLLEAGTL